MAKADLTEPGTRAAAAPATAPPPPGSRTAGAWALLRRGWARLPESLREALLPYAVARAVVLGALGLAHFIVDRTHPEAPGVAARVHAGLLSWDAGWYETIARVGYGTWLKFVWPLLILLAVLSMAVLTVGAVKL